MEVQVTSQRLPIDLPPDGKFEMTNTSDMVVKVTFSTGSGDRITLDLAINQKVIVEAKNPGFEITIDHPDHPFDGLDIVPR